VDYGRDEEELAEEEEDSSEGVGGAWMTRQGRFGWQADPRSKLPRSRGIFRIVGERKCASNRVGEDKSKAGKGWVGGGALRRKSRRSVWFRIDMGFRVVEVLDSKLGFCCSLVYK